MFAEVVATKLSRLPASTRPLKPHALSTEHSIELLKVVELVRLASQHHASEYNRLRFGPAGSPTPYVPLSIHNPDEVRRLQEHQVSCTEQRLWWPCSNPAVIVNPDTVAAFDSDDTLDDPDIPVTGPHLILPAPAQDLQEELFAAISSPLVSMDPPPVPPVPAQLLLKTSQTHPLNIAPIIPPELLDVISSHLRDQTDRSAVMFELPSHLLLDQLAARPSLLSLESDPQPAVPLVPPSLSQPRSASSRLPFQTVATSSKLVQLLWPKSERRTLFSAVNLSIGNYSRRPESPVDIVLPRTVLFPAPAATRVSNSTVSPFRATGTAMECEKSGVSKLGGAHASLVLNSKVSSKRSSKGRQLRSSVSFHTERLSFTSLKGPKALSSFLYPYSTHSIPKVSIPRHPIPQRTSLHEPRQSSPRTLGNLFLSSCPGKKVRLNGPAKGRCAVSRDLRMDLRRLKILGVACIICCLDDEELGLLGVSWEEYSRISGEFGMDVLRIPIPEGLAPADPALLDSQLSSLINDYTLRGASLLVHCRGGVGRAGLLACCWMLKIGLCGWLEPSSADAPTSRPATPSADGKQGSGTVRSDVLRLVEKAIAVVRRRRSLKAIETYEQVQFLADFVEHLRTQSSPNMPPEELFADWDVQVD